jgi:oligopeptide transport system permease protein
MMQSTAPSSAGGSLGTDPGATALMQEADLAYESGVQVKARSQWQYARMRFFRHKLAVGSLVVLIFFGLVAIFAERLAPYGFDEINLETVDPETGLALSPRLDDWHIFGTDQLGRDYLSRIIYGIRTSLWVALFVALLSTAIGTAVGALAGYYGGKVDNLLMRFTDLILTIPGLAVLLTAAVYFGSNDSEVTLGPLTFTIPQPMKIGLILAFLFWVGLARIVRGLFLSLREKEFIEAAKAAGASDLRIIVRHILPNCVGPIVVFTTLIVAAAILTEAALSFIGYGIQPPNAALGKLIVDGQS